MGLKKGRGGRGVRSGSAGERARRNRGGGEGSRRRRGGGGGWGGKVWGGVEGGMGKDSRKVEVGSRRVVGKEGSGQ